MDVSSTTDTSSDESYKPVSKKKLLICTYEGCSASFSKNSKLVYHIRRHTGERPFVCDEPNCNKSYLYSFHLRRHKEVAHRAKESIKRIRCTYEGCFQELVNKYSLKKHIRKKHDPYRHYPYSCKECKQGFLRKRQLVQHSYVHTGILPYKCELCGNGFATTRDCGRHRRTHTSYPCKCGQTFERWSTLLKHKKKCEASNAKCDFCGRTFKQSYNLTLHRQTHLDEKSEVYTCGYEGCSRSYSYKKNLITHIEKYHRKVEKTRIACTYPGCKQTFTKNQNLLLHTSRFHTNKVITKKSPRKPRKDKGKPRHSTAALLAGVELPLQVHRAVIEDVPLKSLSDLKQNTGDIDNSRGDVAKVKRASVNTLKLNLQHTLVSDLKGNESEDSSSNNTENSKTYVEMLC